MNGQDNKSGRGFTLIELLVVIAIIALLLSIVVPSLRVAKEVASRTICGTNLKALGQGVFVYANNNNDTLPPSFYIPGGTGPDSVFAQPSASYWIFSLRASITLATPAKERVASTYGFGHLYMNDIVDTGEIFYCPSTPATPQLGSDVDYRYATYSMNGTAFPWNNLYGTGATGNTQAVRSSYNYVPQAFRTSKQNSLGSGMGRFPDRAVKSSQLYAGHAMACDLLFHLDYLPHKRGSSRTGYGVNVLYSDGGVRFSNNPEAFDPKYWMSGTTARDIGKDEYVFRTILSLLQ